MPYRCTNLGPYRCEVRLRVERGQPELLLARDLELLLHLGAVHVRAELAVVLPLEELVVEQDELIPGEVLQDGLRIGHILSSTLVCVYAYIEDIVVVVQALPDELPLLADRLEVQLLLQLAQHLVLERIELLLGGVHEPLLLVQQVRLDDLVHLLRGCVRA